MTQPFEIVFAPLLPMLPLIVCVVLVLVLSVVSVIVRARGGVWRMVALVGLLGLLANPMTRQADRRPLTDHVAIVVDQSASQELGERAAQTEAALENLENQLAAFEDIETRRILVGDDVQGTRLFTALESGLADAPKARLAGVIMLSDGRAHDAPSDLEGADIGAPLHVALTGEPLDFDRKLTILKAPRFGVVGERVDLQLQIDDLGAGVPAETAFVRIWRDGELAVEAPVPTGIERTLRVPIEHAGPNVIEIETAALDGELTALNNRAVASINGVQDRLRVLLVSGEPNAGERTWRNLLKSDPAVDLVHFTILRPPDKADFTPVEELALIPFPKRELFEEKLTEFDLIVFDRYRLFSTRVLYYVHFDNIVRFIEDGGAVLFASGPSFAGPYSLARSPLASVLPVLPTGEIHEQGYRPRLTRAGLRHPVTLGLPLANNDPSQDPNWGRWFRQIDAEAVSGETLMTGAGEAPLLVLDRFGEGRVAHLTSDHAWLWSRGYENGGPHAELLRRVAHWLMKEPDLEEEDLSATVREGALLIRRRTMKDETPPVTVTSPSGEATQYELEQDEDGLWSVRAPAGETGLYRITDGELFTVAATGPLNPREYADVLATDTVLGPIARANGGGVFHLHDGALDLRRVREGRDTFGDGPSGPWAGLVRREQYQTQSVEDSPAAPPWAWLALIGVALMMGWRRESA